jgi:hypothetical protein
MKQFSFTTSWRTFIDPNMSGNVSASVIIIGWCRVRVSRGLDYEFSHNATFDRLLKDGCEPMDIYHAICTQVTSPTQPFSLFFLPLLP